MPGHRATGLTKNAVPIVAAADTSDDFGAPCATADPTTRRDQHPEAEAGFAHPDKNRQPIIEFFGARGGTATSTLFRVQHYSAPFPRCCSAQTAPSRAVWCDLLGAHACWMLIGACDPMLQYAD